MAAKNIQGLILSNLKASPDGLQTDELSEKLDLTRHTVAKYLEILRAEGKIHFRKVGRSRLWKDISASIDVRMLSIGDLGAILEIDERLRKSGNLDDPERAEFLQETATHHLEQGDPLMNLGAEIDGKLVGFVLADTGFGEFGSGEKTGWIKVLGVDPEYQGRGVGQKLGEKLMDHFERKNVKRVRTLVAWHDGDLISYFKSLGFDILNMIPLEKGLDRAGGNGRADEGAKQ